MEEKQDNDAEEAASHPNRRLKQSINRTPLLASPILLHADIVEVPQLPALR